MKIYSLHSKSFGLLKQYSNKMARPVKHVKTLQEKLRIIEEVERNPTEKKVHIAKRLGLPVSSLNTIIEKKQEIREQVKKCGTSAKKRKTRKEAKYSCMEAALFSWYQQARASRIPVDGNILREKARSIAARMCIKNFVASNGWISRFKERHGLVYKKLAGESAAVDGSAVEEWGKNLPELVEGYEPKDVYNADETGLFFNCLPDRTLALKGESCHGGKSAKDRITVLLCCNSDGSDKRIPIVIGKAAKPRCFKNIKKLPVQYYANGKAWMTTDIFLDFLHGLDASMGAQGRKIILFLDNCAAHPRELSFLRNVKVIFYPPNCTSVLQPLDAGVIKCFKGYYRKQLVERAVCMLDAGKEVKMTFSILQAIHFVVSAWFQVSPATLQNCFRKCGFGESRETNDTNTVNEEQLISEDWEKLAPRDVNFDTYATVDSELATCGVMTVEQLCDEATAATSESAVREIASEGEDEDEIEPLPTFAEALAAFDKIRNYISAYDTDGSEVQNILNVEGALYRVKTRQVKKQLTIKDFFTTK